MNDLLKERLKNSKLIIEKLIKEGYCIPISWEDVERAMIYNYNKLEKYNKR